MLEKNEWKIRYWGNEAGWIRKKLMNIKERINKNECMKDKNDFKNYKRKIWKLKYWVNEKVWTKSESILAKGTIKTNEWMKEKND